MSSRRTRGGSRRALLLEELRAAGRRHSDATVIFHGAIADRLGIHSTDEKTMSLLEREGPMLAGAIAEKTGLATASVTALLDRLESRGFIRRTRDPADRRRVIVEADRAGVAKFAPLFKSTAESLEKLYTGFDDDALAVILEFFLRNTDRLREETARIELR